MRVYPELFIPESPAPVGIQFYTDNVLDFGLIPQWVRINIESLCYPDIY
jgi:hypothetical protein